MNDAFTYLAAARQARLASRACVGVGDRLVYRDRARFWLAVARQARSPPLP